MRVERAILDVHAALSTVAPTDFSLARGTAGLALARAALERSGIIEPGGAGSMAAEALALSVTSSNEAGLFQGLTGPAWTLTHLGVEAHDPGDDPCSAIDDALADLVARGGSDECYDLLEGLVGIGIYASERLLRTAAAGTLLDAVIGRLANLAVETRHGVTWHTAPAERKERIVMNRPARVVGHVDDDGVKQSVRRMRHCSSAPPPTAPFPVQEAACSP